MPAKANLIGQKFGRLTVVSEVGRQNGKVTWRCACDCGGEIVAPTGPLRSGNTKSCGCYRNDTSGDRTRLDLSGSVFGRLTAIKPVGRTEHNKVLWRCGCECGGYSVVPAGSLRSGKTQSCGCLRKEQLSRRVRADIAGKRFGALVALESVGTNSAQSVIWRCACDCGNSAQKTASALLKGYTKSCGCLSTINKSIKAAKALVGKKFSRLTIIAVNYQPAKQGGIRAKCACDCGNAHEAALQEIKRGKTQSCGCLAAEVLKMPRPSMQGENHPCYTHGLSDTPEYKRAACHKRRARLVGSGGEYSPAHVAVIYEHQEGKCNGCGGVFEAVDLTHDHIRPLADGGANEAANIQLLCRSCNSRKHTKDFFAWMTEAHGWKPHEYARWFQRRMELNKRLEEIQC